MGGKRPRAPSLPSAAPPAGTAATSPHPSPAPTDAPRLPAGVPLTEAPTFSPTDDEFANPLRYILSIREEAERYGICCIRPPPSWKPPFMLDLNRLKFPTRVQQINELMVRKVQRMKFMKELVEFSDASGTPLSKLPLVGGKPLDLHLLYAHVARRGGFETTTAARQWTAVAHAMNLHQMKAERLAPILKRYYQQLLLPFERCRRGLDPLPAALAAAPGGADDDGMAGAEGALPSSGGSLMSRRGLEVITLTAGGVERSNAEACDQVIAYEPPREGEELCEVCGSGDDNESILLCDKCNCGFHMRCLKPPLSKVPAGEWFCSLCLNEKFGFNTSRVFKYHQFERQANSFKHAFFESLFETATSKLAKRLKDGAPSIAYDAEARALGRGRLPDFEVPPDEVEWQFWNIVQTPDQPLEVLYGSDLDTLQFGSGFPLPNAAEAMEGTLDKKELSAVKRYAAAGWNLNNLCRLDKCVLAHCSELVSGMVVPWLYVGMLFSSFCWHVEDHYAHSINYMHSGAPKTWYGVPGVHADLFERVMQEAMPELMAAEAGLLYKMTTMLPPAALVEGGVSVCHLLQQPGTFVITWPRAYHAGFSHGLNCAESSNFATPDWLPWGRASVKAYRTVPGSRRPCFTHEMLLCALARKARLLSPHISIWVRAEMEEMISEEERDLAAVRRAGVHEEVLFPLLPNAPPMLRALSTPPPAGGKGAAPPPAAQQADGAETADVGPACECPSCAVCNYECYLSAVECALPDGSYAYVCLMHSLNSSHAAATLPSEKKTLLVFRPVEWLRSTFAAVAACADAANEWIARAECALGRRGGQSCTLAEAQAIVDEGVHLRMDDEHMLVLSRACKDAAAVSAKVQALVGTGTRGKRGSLAQCEECLREAEAIPLQIAGVEALHSLAARGREWEAAAGALLASPSPAEAPLEQLLLRAEELPLLLPSRAAAERSLAVCQWEARHAQLWAGAPPSVAELRALAAAGGALCDAPPPTAAAVRQVEELLAAAAAWAGRAAALCRRARLEELSRLAAAAPPRVELPQRAALAARAAAAAAWVERHAARRRRPAEEAEEGVRQAAGLGKVEEVAEGLAALREALAWRDEWLRRARDAFVKPGDARGLLAALRRHERSWPPSDEENLHCCAYCSPDDEAAAAEATWVGCDGCDGWFHAACLGVPAAQAEALDAFACPRCCSLRGEPFAFGAASVRSTRRPALARVEALTAEAAAQPLLELPEAEAMLALQRQAEQWGARARALLPHGEASAMPAAAAEELAALLREADTLEVVPEELKALRSLVLAAGGGVCCW